MLQGAKEVAASKRTPLVFPIGLDLLRGMAADMAPGRGSRPGDPFSITPCQSDLEMEEALLRYLRQCDGEEACRLLAPITARESMPGFSCVPTPNRFAGFCGKIRRPAVDRLQRSDGRKIAC